MNESIKILMLMTALAGGEDTTTTTPPQTTKSVSNQPALRERPPVEIRHCPCGPQCECPHCEGGGELCQCNATTTRRAVAPVVTRTSGGQFNQPVIRYPQTYRTTTPAPTYQLPPPTSGTVPARLQRYSSPVIRRAMTSGGC